MNDSLDTRFRAARKKYIESRFSMLNEMQRQAVFTTPAPRMNPHVTLAYDDDFADPCSLDRPIRWTVDEVFLTLKRPDGSPLKRLARWKLPAKGAIRLADAERYVSRPVQLALPGLFRD